MGKSMTEDGNRETIVCLGWGSLIWDPRGLPIEPSWYEDGPLVQVEFLRHSGRDRITLVLHESAAPVPSLWAKMTVCSLPDAIGALTKRENTSTRNIGCWSLGGGQQSPCIAELSVWARRRAVTHVIWTDLPPKFNNEDGVCPTADEVIAYLSNLSGKKRDEAMRYIQNAPVQIDTAYRRHIATKLGW